MQKLQKTSILFLFLICLLVPYGVVFSKAFGNIYEIQNTWVKVNAKFHYEQYNDDGETTHLVYFGKIDGKDITTKDGSILNLESDWGSAREVFYLCPANYEIYYADYELLYVWVMAVGTCLGILLLCTWLAVNID